MWRLFAPSSEPGSRDRVGLKSSADEYKQKMSKSHIVCVRFIRKDDVDTAGSRDDVAKIKRVGNDIYSVEMRNVDSVRAVKKEMILTSEGVRDWFERTLRLMDADFVPFEQYQFDFPVMPSVLIHHRELHHHLPTLLNAMDFHLENWPQTYTVAPTHLYFDEDDE
jgi:hypothetical protein